MPVISYLKASLVLNAPVVPVVLPRTKSIRHAAVEVAPAAGQPVATPGPSVARSGAKPACGYVTENVASAVLSVRIVLAAAELLAAMRDRTKFGIAIAAMIRMMATTISSSINEKPFCLRMLRYLLFIPLVVKPVSFLPLHESVVALVIGTFRTTLAPATAAYALFCKL